VAKYPGAEWWDIQAVPLYIKGETTTHSSMGSTINAA
jgi:hypothetical protein